ncbi:NlpC/P60 family protein [Streptomyces goshikiensis]|uniref:NlpC/P60 family protein n=1 Tax=Streptomyces goshikiensis TaxID=1942 RepID=UPI003667A6E3
MDPPDPTLPRAPPPPPDRTGVGPVAGEGDRVHTQLPRTAAAQYETTAHRPVSRGELLPGDRPFWAHRNVSIYHVGLYAGSGRVLHAPVPAAPSRWHPSTPPCPPPTTAAPPGLTRRKRYRALCDQSDARSAREFTEGRFERGGQLWDLVAGQVGGDRVDGRVGILA